MASIDGRQMGDPLSSFLRGSGDANDPVRLALLRQQQADEMRHNQQTVAQTGGVTGSTPSDVQGLEQDIENAPGTGRQAQQDVQQQDALRNMLFTYNRPDVANVRNQQAADAIKLAVAPAEMAGKYSVQAAEAAGKERAIVAQEAQQAQDARQQVTQQGLDQRAVANQQGINDRQRVTGLESGKINMPRPANEGILSRFFTGPSQATLNQQEIQRLQGGGGQAAPASSGQAYQGGDQVSEHPAIGEMGIIQGHTVRFDGHGWAVVGQ